MASGQAVSGAPPERSKVGGLRRTLYSNLTKNVIININNSTIVAKERTRYNSTTSFTIARVAF